ncbi:MAG: acetate kinase, partial [Bacteroidota bacterium]
QNRKATTAFDIFCYRITKYLGAYAAAMGGLDAIVFTGGIGENSPDVREACVTSLGFLGINLDRSKNQSEDKEKIITTSQSKTAVLVVPTNEELVIALETMRIVKEGETERKAEKQSKVS